MIARLLSLFLSLSMSLGMSLETLGTQTGLGGYLFLVNRQYALSSEYVPDDLVRPDVKHTSDAILMRKDAAAALEQLFAAAKEEAGLTLYAHSGYRSYSTQSAIFDRKISTTGSREKAMKLVAPPGTSEHQLGLAMDLKATPSSNLSSAFASTKQGIWVAENAWRFGFIIRYKKEWEETTGYSYEPWHIRYVGTEHAKILHELDIPLEDYIPVLQSAALAQYAQGE